VLALCGVADELKPAAGAGVDVRRERGKPVLELVELEFGGDRLSDSTTATLTNWPTDRTTLR
jgi:hypothetical protein